MKDLYLMMSSEEVERNFTRGNFNCVKRETLHETDSIIVDLLTIGLDFDLFQFTETTLLGKGGKRVYSELVLVK